MSTPLARVVQAAGAAVSDGVFGFANRIAAADDDAGDVVSLSTGYVDFGARVSEERITTTFRPADEPAGPPLRSMIIGDVCYTEFAPGEWESFPHPFGGSCTPLVWLLGGYRARPAGSGVRVEVDLDMAVSEAAQRLIDIRETTDETLTGADTRHLAADVEMADGRLSVVRAHLPALRVADDGSFTPPRVWDLSLRTTPRRVVKPPPAS